MVGDPGADVARPLLTHIDHDLSQVRPARSRPLRGFGVNRCFYGASVYMSQIRRRGHSLQVTVYAGLDPVTGKRVYLSHSTTDLAEAKRIQTKFRAQVVEQRNAAADQEIFAEEERTPWPP